MDAPRLPAAPLRRRSARGALALSRAARRALRAGPVIRPEVITPASADPITLVDVIRGLAWRPAAIGGLVALVLAVGIHLGVGGLSASIRPAKRAAARTASVAVEVPVEVLGEDLPPPPPPPERPPPPPPTSTSAAPSSSAPSSMASTSRPMPPGLSPRSFGVGGVDVGGAAFGRGGQALPSSTPRALATTEAIVTPARAVSRPPPRYPAAARRDGLTGVVVLAIQVDARGEILDVRVVESDPAGVFDAAAIESVRAWRFAPATRDGVPVTTWVRQSIRFTLEAS